MYSRKRTPSSNLQAVPQAIPFEILSGKGFIRKRTEPLGYNRQKLMVHKQFYIVIYNDSHLSK
jgi:hypothetical protein